ncbi:Golgi-specific brefeldin A-resistance guanine nucleotide exchange factor 1 [Trametes pubescens]|uniref:Golgi-specific brefeldin A-resistance guanine nucleotide exchange factor 1 n=1 Tax=Trametes pubescens TaxID=154538 RepID=A0A1M2VSW7_TRAPU|nr:Golgi-specific brefeldin A-resistance guanine nucleotide exchange factor 1 [Trametes pubescens]
MESSTAAEQRATAVAKLKRAASLPRMKDGRRPPMHVEAVSEGERSQSEERMEGEEQNGIAETLNGYADDAHVEPTPSPEEEAAAEADEEDADMDTQHHSDQRADSEGRDAVSNGHAVVEDPVKSQAPADGTPTRKRRSRSRTRSRGSRDMKGKAKQAAQAGSASQTNESSADEYYTSALNEDPPPSPPPPLVSPIPYHIPAFTASQFLRSPISPAPLRYPGTTPSTPLPSLDDIQRSVGAGLFRSNSAGAARAMAMSKLTGEPFDMTFMSQASTSGLGAKLIRNNTVSGGERMMARNQLLHRLGNRINQTDGEQTSGGEEAPPATAPKKKNRRRRRSSSRASTVVDDREDREVLSASARNTPLPLPPRSPLLPVFRATPEPPRSTSSAGQFANGDAERGSPRLGIPYGLEIPLGHRGPVIEDEDDLPDGTSPPRLPNLPTTPARNHRLAGLRIPHTSDAPSNASTDSAPGSAVAVPMFMSSNPSNRDLFPASPFQTPLKEHVYPDEEGMHSMYQEQRSRSRLAQATNFERGSEISWVAELVQERPLVNDDEDDEDEDEDEVEEPTEELPGEEPYPDAIDPRSSREFSPTSERPTAPNPLVVDVETSPELYEDNVPPSPASPLVLSIPEPIPAPEVLPSPQTYPMRLSVAAPGHLDRSPSAADYATDWDESKAESTPKRGGEGGSISTWMKNTFTRTNSTNGRRSRTNSVSARERRYNTDSSVSRESGASLNSGKVEKADASPGPSNGVFAMQQAQAPVMQSTSSSTSMLSLAPQSAPPGGVSPVPPASSADYLKYADSKLFPFPALKQLEEQRNRARAMTPSASSPDVLSPTNGFPMEMMPSSSSSSGATTTKFAEGGRERKLSHQASDSRLWSKFSQPLGSAPSSSSHPDYFNIHPPVISPTTSTSGSLGKLPTTRDGVKKWLSRFKSQSSTPSTPTAQPTHAVEPHPQLGQKPSLSDLLIARENSELSTKSWDSTVSDKSRTPTNLVGNQRMAQPQPQPQPQEAAQQQYVADAQYDRERELPRSPRTEAAEMSAGTSGAASPHYVLSDHSSPGFPSPPPDPPSSTTPDPQSSLDDFPTRSTSESFSSTMSSSQHSPDPPVHEHSAGAIIMERFESVLGRGSKSSLWPSAIDDPPRKLVLSSPVLQVANANTVKDRFLFLFTDILIIAKLILREHDTLLDATRPDPTDRKFVIKSVVQLKELRLSSDRDDARTKTAATANPSRHPVIQTFVRQFATDPDHAISTLVGKAGARDDIAVGQLLFRTPDLDRARLGEFLARRSSKVALKAYVDSFGLTGLRIDKALRVFLQSIHVPAKTPAGHSNPLDYLLDSFASRWYEANAAIVAYDKDLAIRLVRAIAQLNDVMHGGVSQEPGPTPYPKRNVITRDFVEAFKRFDTRILVSDELLDKIYTSVRRERLAQARHPSSLATQPDIVINVKRPLPPRLTYRMQSEPVILRIPQPDPHLTIQLFGQDLVFEPSVLNFAKSSEVSFRVTGTQLGNKTIIMWRSGPNALAYCGLPLSSPVAVERSFMRNTFQVAFVNHTGLKRRYMFSVDDPLMRHQWTLALKRQIDIASAASETASHFMLPTSRAAEALAFKVLQETLISPEDSGSSYAPSYPSPVDQALARLNGASRSRSGSVSSSFGNTGPQRRSRPDGPSAHVRSKSRSQLYRRHGPGKMESELDDEDERGAESSTPSHARIWSLHDLETVCRQNSSIPSVLAYLQVGLLDQDRAANGTAS